MQSEVGHRLGLPGRAGRPAPDGVEGARRSRYRAAHLQHAPTRETRQGPRAAYCGLLFRQTGRRHQSTAGHDARRVNLRRVMPYKQSYSVE